MLLTYTYTCRALRLTVFYDYDVRLMTVVLVCAIFSYDKNASGGACVFEYDYVHTSFVCSEAWDIVIDSRERCNQ